MLQQLTPIEIRVLGCLIEKEATTPDAYPLTLNALTNACNQKTSRDPVMNLSDATVLEAVEHLLGKMLVATRSGASSRVPKYAHRLRERLDPEFDFSPPELAVMGTLMLRGAQTGGEIRIRSARLYEFEDAAELDATLNRLAEREDGPYLVKLARQTGHKEPRYAHLLAGKIEMPSETADSEPLGDEQARVAELEIKVSHLRNELDELRQRFDDFARQFE